MELAIQVCRQAASKMYFFSIFPGWIVHDSSSLEKMGPEVFRGAGFCEDNNRGDS